MHTALSPLHRRILRKMTALPRPMALTISMISPGLAYLCPLSRGAVSPSPRFSLFPCSSSPRAPLDGAVILAHTPGEEGRRGEGGGGAGPGACRRCAGWLPREDRHKGIWMEASASRYVGFCIKGKHHSFCSPVFTGLLCSSVQGSTGLCLCSASFPPHRES